MLLQIKSNNINTRYIVRKLKLFIGIISYKNMKTVKGYFWRSLKKLVPWSLGSKPILNYHIVILFFFMSILKQSQIVPIIYIGNI